MADRWITRVAWTEWRSTERGLCESSFCVTYQTFTVCCAGHAYLACAVADGSVVVLQILQTLTYTPSDATFVAQHELTVTHKVLDDPLCKADKRNVTSLRWIDVPNRNVRL